MRLLEQFVHAHGQASFLVLFLLSGGAAVGFATVENCHEAGAWRIFCVESLAMTWPSSTK
jgi:hypothetical protein